MLIDTDDPQRARAILVNTAEVCDVAVDVTGALTVTLAGDGTAAAVNRTLVVAGLAVARLEPIRESLEERFLDITSRLQSPEEVRA